MTEKTEEKINWTRQELWDEAVARFGDNPYSWAFQCPNCKDVATGQDFSDALDKAPRTHRDGHGMVASDIIGQECIGRTLGALKASSNEAWTEKGGRGCDWVAYDLFGGPWTIDIGEGKTMFSFPLAPKAVS